jgi:RimJ/RimL family protein N-acetyltransferase
VLRQVFVGELPEFFSLIDDYVVTQNGWLKNWRNDWNAAFLHAKDASPGSIFPSQHDYVIAMRADEAGTEKLIGSISILRAAHPIGVAEIGFWMGADFRRQGYTTEAIEAVCRLGFVHLGLERILAEASVDNIGSVRALTKVGFESLDEHTRVLPNGRVVLAQSFRLERGFARPNPCARAPWNEIIPVSRVEKVQRKASALGFMVARRAMSAVVVVAAAKGLFWVLHHFSVV